MNKRLYFLSLAILPLALSSCNYQPTATNLAQPTTETVNVNQNINQSSVPAASDVNINKSVNINESKPSSVNVTLSNFSFNPENITIKKGTTVIWTNSDSVGHTVTANSDSAINFSSNVLNKGESYKFTFNSIGTFNYHCLPHPNMTAQVIVTE